jgi:hypothetical protein
MSPIITRELALKIVGKLDAEIVAGGKAHDIARVRDKGRVIAWFGIRRGSRKDLGHDHVPGNLYITPKQARLLGQCPMLKAEWLEIMAQKGKLPL